MAGSRQHAVPSERGPGDAAIAPRIGAAGAAAGQLPAAIAMCGILLFVSTSVALQFIRADLDWVHTPMSFYLLDAEGRWLQAGYCALAVGIVAVAIGSFRTLAPPARSGAPVLLFLMAAVGLCVTAFAPTWQPGAPPMLAHWLHGVAAQTAFLCVTTAMLLQAWRLRGDPRWRGRFGVAFALAAIAFAGVWLLALWRELPRGLAQKAVILAIVAWLALLAWWLWRTPVAVAGATDE